MKPRLTYCFIQLVVLCLVASSFVSNATGASPHQENDTAVSGSKSVEATDNESEEQVKQSPKLKKPPVLTPIESDSEEELFAALDKLIVNQSIAVTPYVPLIQSIQLSFDYDKLAWNLWRTYQQTQEQSYAANFNILWRKNIQLSGRLGYSELRPSLLKIDGKQQEAYSVVGPHVLFGVSYILKYAPQINLYVGGHYAESNFKKQLDATRQSQSLCATWWELAFGSEQQFLRPWIYAGSVLHIKGLSNFPPSNSEDNYVIPGYGRNVNHVTFDMSFYVKFELSFLEKQFSFGAPKVH